MVPLLAQHYVSTTVISCELSNTGLTDSFLLKPKFSNSKPEHQTEHSCLIHPLFFSYSSLHITSAEVQEQC